MLRDHYVLVLNVKTVYRLVFLKLPDLSHRHPFQHLILFQLACSPEKWTCFRIITFVPLWVFILLTWSENPGNNKILDFVNSKGFGRLSYSHKLESNRFKSPKRIIHQSNTIFRICRWLKILTLSLPLGSSEAIMPISAEIDGLNNLELNLKIKLVPYDTIQSKFD